ncbi:MAG: acetylornithine transaminase [Actinomycetia bacterium]|nr:acetylornithine transaminase [Actinomycetes bacterium]
MNTFGTPAREFVRGEGVWLVDDEGKRYLDLLGGIATNSLGHAHPRFVQAISEQVATVSHVSNLFTSVNQIALGARLTELLGHEARVFLCNSGTEANEAAFKLTRRTGRTRLVAAENGFHGRTMGALTVTHKPAYREPFTPLAGEVTFVPYGDHAALAAAVDDTVAAVVLEPIQGEAGVIVPPEGYLRAAREITASAGALLWLDEVQTGIGRTGAWFDHSREQVVPDLVTVAKGLGNGFPVGACLATGGTADLFQPGMHGTTFGGNPLAARAALTVLEELEVLLPQVVAVGDWLAQALSSMAGVERVDGRGLLRGVQLSEPVGPALVAAALDAGFVLNAPRPDRLRIAPPLVISRTDLEEFIEAWPGLVQAARG